MAITTAVTMVTPIFDDGDAFLFQFLDDNNNTVVSGFIHRPFSASAVDSMTTPPITFSESSDLASWLETIKYAVRNNRVVSITYDDAASNSYIPQWPGAQPITVNVLWAITDVP
jgi:hypothetical protein